MKWVYQQFDKVGEFITSKAIVILLMVPFMWYRFFEFNTLFGKWLPMENESDKASAAVLISLVLIAMTLVFMVNIKRLFPFVNWILAGNAFVLNLFFWSLKPDSNWWFILFISAVIASMDYGLGHLFDAHQRESVIKKDLSALLKEHEVIKADVLDLKDAQAELEPFISKYKLLKAKCYCSACEKTFGSPQAKNGHKCEMK